MNVVVCYDVSEDRRRTRLMKRLRALLTHVQKSVFEGDLTDERLTQLQATILDEIDPETDTVRIYRRCARCGDSTAVLGTGIYVDTDDADEIM